jgi:segregation and condensation protein A
MRTPAALVPLQQTIDSLTALAEQGAIDPWDVRVIDVIDRYFQQLQAAIARQYQHPNKTAYELHLAQSAQAFVSAAVLVLLKADHLSAAEFPVEVPEELPEAVPMEPDPGALGDRPRPQLENWIKRRGVAPPLPQRRVALQDMISQLQAVADTLATRPRSRPPKRPTRSQKVKSIRQLAHQENLTEVAHALDGFLAGQVFADLAPGAIAPWITLDQLMDRLAASGRYVLAGADAPLPMRDPNPQPLDRRDRVAVFWALLLLASQSKVELDQTEFYQELRIRRMLPQREPVPPTAISDPLEALPRAT